MDGHLLLWGLCIAKSKVGRLNKAIHVTADAKTGLAVTYN
jgi:hypothetical protein